MRPGVSRRRLLRWMVGAAAGALVYALRIEPHWLELVRRPLRVHRLPRELVGHTLALLSDLHVGPKVDDTYLLETFARTAALDPDIVAVAGDFTTHHSGVFDHADRVLAHLPRGRLATVGVLGNHDYGRSWAHPEVADKLSEILRGLGIDVLRNQAREVGGLTLVGLDDLWGGQFRPADAFADLRPDRAVIVLSHNPDTVDLPGWGEVRGWVLSGHTHGGQCKPPFLPPPFLPVRNRRYTAGEFALAGDRRLYISRGVGHLLAARFNVRPEATLFELQPLDIAVR